MNKKSFISFFVATNLILVFLQIHKHTLFIKNSYEQQQCEKKIATLTEKKQTLTQELHSLKDRQNIKKYAQNILKMRPYTLNQIKKL